MKHFMVALMAGALMLPSAGMAQQHRDHEQGNNRPQQNHPDQHRPGQNRPQQPGRPDPFPPHKGQERPGQSHPQPNRPDKPRPLPAPAKPVRPPQQNMRPPAGSWQNFRNYDYNRPGTGNRKYYADRYYRDGANYKPFKVTRNTRIYRGGNGRYYCRRSDGTTGLIAGIAVGGILGNFLGDGDSALLSTVLGAGVGGVLGREIDRGNVQCR